MKNSILNKEDCHRYPLQYISANIQENGLILNDRHPISEYYDDEKPFWLALRANVNNDNCFAFSLHNWPSIVRADSQWSPHTTQLWDTIVDVCNGGFPQSTDAHLYYMGRFIPLLNETHYSSFKEDIFKTWSPNQWRDLFDVIGNAFEFEKDSVKIISALIHLTDDDVSQYVAHLMLSWLERYPTHVNELAQTTVGGKALYYIKENWDVSLAYVLHTFTAFNEDSHIHKALYTLSSYIDVNLDDTVQKIVARGFLLWVGTHLISQRFIEEYERKYAQELMWMKGLWNTLPDHIHNQIIQDVKHSRSLMARGAEVLLGWGFDADHVCRELDASGEINTTDNNAQFPRILARLQSEHLKQELRQQKQQEKEYEKTRKI